MSRFTPISGHRPTRRGCPLSAITGHPTPHSITASGSRSRTDAQSFLDAQQRFQLIQEEGERTRKRRENLKANPMGLQEARSALNRRYTDLWGGAEQLQVNDRVVTDDMIETRYKELQRRIEDEAPQKGRPGRHSGRERH
jgi:uncharacterized protein (DUF3084 family)